MMQNLSLPGAAVDADGPRVVCPDLSESALISHGTNTWSGYPGQHHREFLLQNICYVTVCPTLTLIQAILS